MKRSDIRRNGWFGFGWRVAYCRDDFFILMVRFAVWELWLEWEL